MFPKLSEKRRVVLIEITIYIALFLVSYVFNLIVLLNGDVSLKEALVQVKPAFVLGGIAYVGVGMFRLLVKFFGKSVKSFDKYSNPEQF